MDLGPPCPGDYNNRTTRLDLFSGSTYAPRSRGPACGGFAGRGSALLDPRTGETWVDCTVGGGGHARLIAEKIGPSGRLIGLDQDLTMLEKAQARLAGLPVELVHANFDQLPEVLRNRGIDVVDGVLADLGFASDQVDQAERGFSFREEGPLDMRLDSTTGTTAADLVNTLSERALADLIYEFGEERKSRRVARAIVERRKAKPFATTSELADVVRKCVRKSARSTRRHASSRRCGSRSTTNSARSIGSWPCCRES